jgi:hypothetical protein
MNEETQETSKIKGNFSKTSEKKQAKQFRRCKKPVKQ